LTGTLRRQSPGNVQSFGVRAGLFGGAQPVYDNRSKADCRGRGIEGGESCADRELEALEKADLIGSAASRTKYYLTAKGLKVARDLEKIPACSRSMPGAPPLGRQIPFHQLTQRPAILVFVEEKRQPRINFSSSLESISVID
jgi:hypothetical protein